LRQRPDIERTRPDKAAFQRLLAGMGDPADGATDREHAGEGVAREAQRIEQQRRSMSG